MILIDSISIKSPKNRTRKWLSFTCSSIDIDLVRKESIMLTCPCNVCGNVKYNTHLYCLAVQASFYSNAVECLTAMQEILVRSSAGTKG